jgi:hypothetical protein
VSVTYLLFICLFFADDKPALNANQIAQLKKCLDEIHGKFAKLYGVDPDGDEIAMEIEFKITQEGKLSIKQERPWVY